MYIIAGLGNPTKQYENTRHNVGFDVIDLLADAYHISVTERKFSALCGSGYIEGQKVLLVKPQTYMNLSGESIGAAAQFFKCDPTEELLVICDDVNLDVGQLRIRKKGSAGGHNGLKNIISHLHTEEFARARVGVGQKPDGWDMVDFVLGHFQGEDREIMKTAEKEAASAAAFFVTDGVQEAMNRFNTKKRKSSIQKREQAGESGGGKESDHESAGGTVK